jgi:hypothetical protein
MNILDYIAFIIVGVNPGCYAAFITWFDPARTSQYRGAASGGVELSDNKVLGSFITHLKRMFQKATSANYTEIVGLVIEGDLRLPEGSRR